MNTLSQPLERVKCYADAPDGTLNKFLVYKTYDIDHSIDVLNRLVNQGWKVRAAWHQLENGNSLRIDSQMINGDVTGTYSKKKELENNLNIYMDNLKSRI